MDATEIALLSAKIGFLGAIIGALIGGIAISLSTYMQFRHQKKEKKKERKERLETALAIIDTFLLIEIVENYKKLTKGEKAVKILKREEINDNYLFGENFSYKHFDSIKYEIVKYNECEISDILNIYKMFRDIERINAYKDLTENQKENIKNSIIKCNEITQSA